MKHSRNELDRGAADPFGLRQLSAPIPESGRMEQDWSTVVAALRTARQRRRAWLGGLAAAASVVLVVALVAIPRPATTPADESTTTVLTPPGNQPGETVATGAQPSTADLVSISQDIERQLRFLREQVGSRPAEFVVYQVELQDLIGQIDDALSLSPESADLWAQRLSLQLDLMKLYRDQLRRDHLRVASL